MIRAMTLKKSTTAEWKNELPLDGTASKTQLNVQLLWLLLSLTLFLGTKYKH
jgi:hypothetical protein